MQCSAGGEGGRRCVWEREGVGRVGTRALFVCVCVRVWHGRQVHYMDDNGRLAGGLLKWKMK